MAIENITDVYHFLDAIPTFKAESSKAANFSLKRFKKFCAAIGHPQRQFASIHVAGTNGKGSTCHLLASMYSRGGYEVGVYSSPHIVDYAERFTINGRPINDADLLHFFQAYGALLKSFRLTYFEISTAIAFWWFAHRGVDIAMVEVGLGGRLDATNIITPLAAVITTVSLDHTDILGDTIEAIAAEKAGIIKPGIPVILGNVPDEAREIIEQVAKKKHAVVYESTRLHPVWNEGGYSLRQDDAEIALKSTLRTPVQAYNIAAAWQTAQLLQASLPLAQARQKQGIARVGEAYPNVARFEKIHAVLNWYFDGAHNLQAVQAMKNMIEKMQPVSQTPLILSLMSDKINKKMMEEFLEFKKIIYYTLPLARAADFAQVKQWLPDAYPFPAEQPRRDSLLKDFQSELVMFAGSFYFYPTAWEWVSSLAGSR